MAPTPGGTVLVPRGRMNLEGFGMVRVRYEMRTTNPLVIV
jgi:hypothetical protein